MRSKNEISFRSYLLCPQEVGDILVEFADSAGFFMTVFRKKVKNDFFNVSFSLQYLNCSSLHSSQLLNPVVFPISSRFAEARSFAACKTPSRVLLEPKPCFLRI